MILLRNKTHDILDIFLKFPPKKSFNKLKIGKIVEYVMSFLILTKSRLFIAGSNLNNVVTILIILRNKLIRR